MDERLRAGPPDRVGHRALLLDAACDRFESAWRARRRPRIEDCLDEAAPAERSGLLRELLQVELELRRGDGEDPGIEEYRGRFPGCHRLIAEAFAHVDRSEGTEAVATLRMDPPPGHGGGPDRAGAKAMTTAGYRAAAAQSRFRILRRHAWGGLGEVFLAYDEELHREVALKEIRPDRADDSVSRARFLLEAEVTGSLEHPGIVPVYGLGEFSGGRPYYAMRFIRGDSLKAAIARFHVADGPGRDPGERAMALRGLLRRFVDVCNAIAYAHSRGVIHRDLKPANIMLGKFGETLVVDWGLAKAIGRADGGAGVVTEPALRPPAASGSTPTIAGSALGTPAYMSPEQATGELDRLGPRSDIYGLGATLYGLLAGRAPLDDRDGDTEELLRRARAGEIDPPRQVKREVPAALEAVCLKAMARLPEDRYDSAQALAEDIEHWLADEPVSAWREPWPARARRWTRRHRTTVAAMFVALGCGVIGLGAVAGVQAQANLRLGSAWDATAQALHETQRAKQSADEALAETRRAQAEAQATLEFFEDKVLAAARPKDQEGGLGIEATIHAAVDAAEPEIERAFADQPVVEASIRNTLGLSYLHLSEPTLAIRQHERALALRRQVFGHHHHDTLVSITNLARAYEEAGRLADAILLHEEDLRLSTAEFGPDHTDTLVSMNNLARAYREAGRFADAIPLHEDVLMRRRASLGPDHRATLISMNNLALAYCDAGRLDDAIPLHEEDLRRSSAKFGRDHPGTLISMNNLGKAYLEAGRPIDAIPLLEEARRRQRSRLGPDHRATLVSMNTLARAYREAGRFADALPLHEEGLRRGTAKLGRDHPSTLIAMNNLALDYRDAGRLADAIPLLEEGLRRSTAKLGRDHPVTLTAMNNLAWAYQDTGRSADAIALFEEALKGRKAKLGRDAPDTLASIDDLARAYLATRPALAEPLLRNALAIRQRKAPDHWRTLEARNLLGSSLLGQRKYAEAEVHLVQGYEGMKAREARIPVPQRSRLREAGERIIRLYESWNKPDQASAWKARLGLRDLPADPFAPP
jgi:tetratricopeptide (TPR) repeat protein/tRNA A-37 threonylcarbamoyl transferase component Bud32